MIPMKSVSIDILQPVIVGPDDALSDAPISMPSKTPYIVTATYEDGSTKDFTGDDRVDIAFAGSGRSLVELSSTDNAILAKSGRLAGGNIVVVATINGIEGTAELKVDASSALRLAADAFPPCSTSLDARTVPQFTESKTMMARSSESPSKLTSTQN